MRFDICLPNAMEGFLAPAGFAGPAEIVRFAREAERLGYNAVWGFDFVNPTPDMGIPAGSVPNWYELMTTLAYVAGLTERLRLVAGVIVLPNREPVILAKQVATIDRLSQGRLDLGIGLGMRPEFETLQPRARGVYRGDLVDEKLAALQLLLGHENEPVSYHGKHVEFVGVNLNPKPVQRPIPMLTAAETPAPLQRAARWGLAPIIHFGQLAERKAQFEPVLAEHGKSLEDFDLTVWADLRVDATSERAAERYLGSTMGRFAKKFRKKADEQLLRENWIGTVDQIVEQLAGLKHAGIDRVVVMHTVTETFEEMLEQTQIFAEDVMRAVEKA